MLRFANLEVEGDQIAFKFESFSAKNNRNLGFFKNMVWVKEQSNIPT